MTTKEKYLKQFKKVPPDKIIYISTDCHFNNELYR